MQHIHAEVEIWVLAGFVLSLAICVAIILMTRSMNWHMRRPCDLVARQAAHHRPTARLGGLGILCGFAASLLVVAPGTLDPAIIAILISTLPVFLAGLAEDLGLRVSPAGRLLAAFMASFLAMALLGQWVSQSGIPGLDILLAIPVIAILITALWGAGLCHAFNLIDGVNGLSAGTAALSALGLALVAGHAGQTGIALAATMLVPAILGFMVLNWPLGKLFLGDSGAYSLGHILAWLAVLLVIRAPEVSVFAMFGLFFWPIADTSFAIWRRQRAGRRPDQPDRLHFHQLIMRALEIRVTGRNSRRLTNPLASAVLLPLIAACIASHVAVWNNTAASAALLGVQASGFVLFYLIVLRLAATRHKRLMRSEVAQGAAIVRSG